MALWRNWLPRSAVNCKAGGSILPSNGMALSNILDFHFLKSDINYLESMLIIAFRKQCFKFKSNFLTLTLNINIIFF